jgi:predicted acylesterase/phospholipase RssA
MEQLTNPNQKRPSWVFGGGGVAGVAIIGAYLDRFRDHGIIEKTDLMLGTSAGSIAAGLVAAELGYDDIADMQQTKWPNRKRGYLESVTGELFGDMTAPNVQGMVWRVGSLAGRRPGPVKMSAREVPLRKVTAASSSVPGIFAPQKIGPDWFVDGGVRSLMSGDLAPESDLNLLIAIAPIGKNVMPRVGSVLEARQRRGVKMWRQIHGGESLFISPPPEATKYITGLDSIFSHETAKQIYPIVSDHAEMLIEENEILRGLSRMGSLALSTAHA